MIDENLSEHIERVHSAQPSAEAHEEGIEAAVRALATPLYEMTRQQRPGVSAATVGSLTVDGDVLRRELANAAIDAYLEALNAH